MSPPLSLRTRSGRGPSRGLGSLGGGDLATSPLTGDSDSGGRSSGDDPRGVLGTCLRGDGAVGSWDGCDHRRSRSGPGDGMVTSVSEKACRPRRDPSARPTTERRMVYRVVATAALAGAVVKL